MNQDEILRLALIGIMILIVIWRVGSGYRKGFIREISTALALVVAAACLFLFMLLYSSLQKGTWGTTVTSVIMLVVFGVGYKLGKLILAPFKGLKALFIIDFIDKILGAVLGLVQAVILLYAIQYVLIMLGKPVIFPVPKIL